MQSGGECKQRASRADGARPALSMLTREAVLGAANSVDMDLSPRSDSTQMGRIAPRQDYPAEDRDL